MSKAEYLGAYAQGFGSLDSAAIAKAVAPGYRLIDPGGTVFTADDLPAVVADLHKAGTEMAITEVMTSETDGKLKAWCLWAVGETVVGAGLITVGPDGVESEWLFAGAHAKT